MKLCWTQTYGPIPINADFKVWEVIHVPSGEDISGMIFYADDETGEVWRFEVDWRGEFKIEGGRPVVEKLVLGPGKIRLERR